jgi:hypothetical protein
MHAPAAERMYWQQRRPRLPRLFQRAMYHPPGLRGYVTTRCVSKYTDAENARWREEFAAATLPAMFPRVRKPPRSIAASHSRA